MIGGLFGLMKEGVAEAVYNAIRLEFAFLGVETVDTTVAADWFEEETML
jgi:hypothetical protein